MIDLDLMRYFMDSINSAQETARNSPEFSLTKNNIITY
jgi:hypothetical protein